MSEIKYKWLMTISTDNKQVLTSAHKHVAMTKYTERRKTLEFQHKSAKSGNALKDTPVPNIYMEHHGIMELSQFN